LHRFCSRELFVA
jgi:hypothetical protein